MKLPHRRHFLHLLEQVLAALPALSRIASAQAYPRRGRYASSSAFPPGTATDIDARLMAQSLSERLGWQVIVDNRPGAGSNVAAEAVVRATPDGYTLLAMTVTNAVNETLYTNLAFDFARDIVPIGGTMLAHNGAGGKSVGSGKDGSRSSSPTPRRIPARSIMRQVAMGPRPTWPPSYSR